MVDVEAQYPRRVVSWERFEAIRAMVSSNVALVDITAHPKHGDTLLAA